MTAQTDHTGPQHTLEVDFDTPSRKGWAHFARFLFLNVVAVVVCLLIIAALTVWR